ncbi:hypothetical protein Hanom_Chr08g00725811 [Helianthus anomalus]
MPQSDLTIKHLHRPRHPHIELRPKPGPSQLTPTAHRSVKSPQAPSFVMPPASCQ